MCYEHVHTLCFYSLQFLLVPSLQFLQPHVFCVFAELVLEQPRRDVPQPCSMMETEKNNGFESLGDGWRTRLFALTKRKLISRVATSFNVVRQVQSHVGSHNRVLTL